MSSLTPDDLRVGADEWLEEDFDLTGLLLSWSRTAGQTETQRLKAGRENLNSTRQTGFIEHRSLAIMLRH